MVNILKPVVNAGNATYVKVANAPGLYRHSRSGRYYVCKKLHGVSRLSDCLSKAVGEAVAVQPVLALPSWYVERTGRGEVIVVSGKSKEHSAACRGIVFCWADRAEI